MKNFAYGLLAAAILGGASLSGAAFAADKSEARLVASVSEPRQVIIDGRLWSCTADKCTAGSQGRSQPIGRECARAAKVLGPVAAYRQGERSLDDKAINACNAATQTARAASGSDVAALTK